MPSINMIAARRWESKQIEKKVRIMFLVVAAEVAAGLMIMSFMSACVFSAGRSLEQTEHKLAEEAPIVQRIDSYTNAVAKLGPKLTLLSDSRQDTMLWCNIMRNLSTSMPEKTWLTGVTTTVDTIQPPAHSKDKPQTKVLISLRGLSSSQRLVGDAMLRLAQCPEFEKVNLNFTEKGNVTGIDAIGFDISAALKPKTEGASNAKN